jgi:hypothetical protein
VPRNPPNATPGVRDSVRASISTKLGGLRIGHVADGFPSWYQYTGNRGGNRWIFGPRDVLMRKPGDPGYQGAQKDRLDNLLEKEPVDVLLMEDCVLERLNPCWTNADLEVIMWLSDRKGRGRQRAPAGWKWSRFRVRHD